MESGNPPSFRKLWEAVRELKKEIGSQKILESPDFRISRLTIGQRIESKATSKVVQTGIIFRGEHVSALSYKKNDMVTILSGTSAGTYICLKDVEGSELPVPPGHPSYGIYWATLPTNQKQAVTWE